MMDKRPRCILMAGPTASGKSALALEVASRLNGVVVNADSMQVYRDLRILTARPSARDEEAVPHRLYGTVSGSIAFSTGKWLEALADILAEFEQTGRPAIITGGTGLYFKALEDGLSPIPDVAEDIRSLLRARLSDEGAEKLYKELEVKDPAKAAALKPADGQRIVRALEVFDATGRPLSEWQMLPGKSLLEAWQVDKLVLLPERELLYARCDARFHHMVERGALEEVDALGRRNLAGDLPVMKALGVQPLLSYAAGQQTLEHAIEEAKRDTRRYAKRQLTWLRGQMADWRIADPVNHQEAIIDSLTR